VSTRAEEKAEYADVLSRALAKLEAEREVLDTREFRLMTGARSRGLTYAEIGAAKGCSAQAVHEWFSRRDNQVANSV
jgi:DNA-directed RNA polymerase specialized sigma24 family protein